MKKSEFVFFLLRSELSVLVLSVLVLSPMGLLVSGFCTFKLAFKPGTSGRFHCCSRRRQWKQQRQCLLTSMDLCVPGQTLNLNPLRVAEAKVVVVLGGALCLMG